MSIYSLNLSRVIGFCTCAVALGLSACGSASPRFAVRESSSKETPLSSNHQLEGIASYYADEFNGRKTSNGEIFDMHAMTAAHRTLPFNTKVQVTNTDNGKKVVVRINDRGPFKDNRVIDLSLEAAKLLGLISLGTAPVKIEILELSTDSQ